MMIKASIFLYKQINFQSLNFKFKENQNTCQIFKLVKEGASGLPYSEGLFTWARKEVDQFLRIQIEVDHSNMYIKKKKIL